MDKEHFCDLPHPYLLDQFYTCPECKKHWRTIKYENAPALLYRVGANELVWRHQSRRKKV